MAGLWELPNTEEEDVLSCLPQMVRDRFSLVRSLPKGKHLFSHIEWRMEGHLFSVPSIFSLSEDFAWVDYSELISAFPLPGAFKVYKKLLKELLSEES